MSDQNSQPSLPARLESRLVQAGYMMVLDHSPVYKDSDVPGFVMARHRRLDNPSREAVVSLDSARLMVTFKKAALPGFVNFCTRMLAPRATTYAAEDAVMKFAKTGTFPAGEANTSYINLAHAFAEAQKTFFVDPLQTNRYRTILTANLPGPRRHGHAGDAPNSVQNFLELRKVMITVPAFKSSEALSLLISACDFVCYGEANRTKPEKIALADFIRDPDKAISRHVSPDRNNNLNLIS